MMMETCQSCSICDEIVPLSLIQCPNCNSYLEQLPSPREWFIVTLFCVFAAVLLMTCIASVLGGVAWLTTRDIRAFVICVTFGATLGLTLAIGFRLVSLFESLLRRQISRTSKLYYTIGRVVTSSMVVTSIAIAIVIVTRVVVGPAAPPEWQFYLAMILGGAVVGSVIGLLASDG